MEYIRVLFLSEDDHHLVLAADLAADVLRDEQLVQPRLAHARVPQHQGVPDALAQRQGDVDLGRFDAVQARHSADRRQRPRRVERAVPGQRARQRRDGKRRELRSEEHTSELQSLMRISYAVFCLKKKKDYKNNTIATQNHDTSTITHTTTHTE